MQIYYLRKNDKNENKLPCVYMTKNDILACLSQIFHLFDLEKSK